jgi:hypothetical protein
MGINNRQRRAAKRRKRRGDAAGSGPSRGLGRNRVNAQDGVTERAAAAKFLTAVLAVLDADRPAARGYAELLTGPTSPVALPAAVATLSDLLRTVVSAVLRAGWSPFDLAELSRRKLTGRHLPALAGLLATEADRYPSDLVAPAWRDELFALGAPEQLDLWSVDGLEVALGLAAVVAALPPIPQQLPPPGTRGPVGATTRSDANVLAKVRSLLAKAESTEFAEEADALSAKAQELISRYALDRLVAEVGHDDGAEPIRGRRIWVEPPYVLAKATLIDVVACANRCRVVTSEQLGFCTVVGDPDDLEAVELLATSLLVQANAAMLRCGRTTNGQRSSRSPSFRRSFLLAYATRIGERLTAATETAAADTGRGAALVPVLRRHAERVDEATGRMFPRIVTRETRISNGLGWAAGRAAADLALLDTNLQVTAQR